VRVPAPRRPLVSVVIASYNHAEFVGDAVNSVLRQSVSDLEVIVADDGSSDGTPDVIEGIRDDRVRLIRLPENRRDHPRNAAMALARGRYVAFQNSDDVWEPTKLETQLAALSGTPNAVACFTGVTVIDESGAPVEGTWLNGPFKHEQYDRLGWLHRFFYHGNCLCMPSAVADRDAIDRVGRFRASLVQCGDFDLWVRLAAVGELVVLRDPLTRMRVLGERNASAPSPATARRSLIERAEALGRYVEPPVLGCLPDVFPGFIASNASRTVRVAALAIHAWSLAPAHRLFADRVFARLLDEPDAREEIITTFGVAPVRDFIARRGEITVETPPWP
jgi:glycosyltransferase involved in cell wall biosynthesis